jgi:hypothetical protein
VSEPPELELLPEDEPEEPAPPAPAPLDLDLLPESPRAAAPRPGELPDAPPWRGDAEEDSGPWFTPSFVRRTLFQGLGVAGAFMCLFSLGLFMRPSVPQLLAALWLSLCAGASLILPLWVRAWARQVERPSWQRVLLPALAFVPCGWGALIQGIYTVLTFEKSRSHAWQVIASLDFLLPAGVAFLPLALLVGVAVGIERSETEFYRWLGAASLLVGLIVLFFGGEVVAAGAAMVLSIFAGFVLLFALILALDLGAALDERLF